VRSDPSTTQAARCPTSVADPMKGLKRILAFLPDPILALGSSSNAPTRAKGRLLDRITAAAVSMLLVGCSSAPSRNILGSYFPSWMICALIGLAATVALRALLAKTGIDAVLPMPIVVYLAFATAISLAIWLLWLA
jgi:hypothetical protein